MIFSRMTKRAISLKLLWALFASAGLLACADSSLVGAALPGLRASVGLLPWEESLFMATYLVGLMLSSIWAGWGLGRWGDRRTLSAGMVLVAVGCGFAGFLGACRPLLFAGRFLHGLGVGSVFVAVPFMIASRCPDTLRGKMNFLFQIMVTFGLVLGSFFGWVVVRLDLGDWTWRLDYLASVVPAALMLVLSQRLPSYDSTRPDRAVTEASVRARPSARVVLAVALPALVQLTGAGAVLCYGVTMLGDIGFAGGNANLGDVVVKAVNLAATAAGMFLVDRLGRRPLVVGGFGAASAGLALAASSILLPGIVPSICAVAGLGLFVAAYAVGPGGCTWLVPAELLPESCRSWGLSLAALGSHAASCAVVAAYRPSALAIGDGGALLVFAGLSLASTILLACLLPETLRTR